LFRPLRLVEHVDRFFVHRLSEVAALGLAIYPAQIFLCSEPLSWYFPAHILFLHEILAHKICDGCRGQKALCYVDPFWYAIRVLVLSVQLSLQGVSNQFFFCFVPQPFCLSVLSADLLSIFFLTSRLGTFCWRCFSSLCSYWFCCIVYNAPVVWRLDTSFAGYLFITAGLDGVRVSENFFAGWAMLRNFNFLFALSNLQTVNVTFGVSLALFFAPGDGFDPDFRRSRRLAAVLSPLALVVTNIWV
jgi:hypothetical protein